MFHGNPLWLNLNLNRKTAPSLVLGRCKVTLEPGDLLYIPSYWFHYTESEEVNFSFNFFFGEKAWGYLRGFRRPFFLYDLFTKQLGLLQLVLSPAIEYGFGDKPLWEKTKTAAELEFLRRCDYS